MNSSRDDQQLQTEWYRVSSRLKAEIGDTAFENWVKPISVSGLEGSEVRLGVPSRFMRDWVKANYLDRLKELWAGENENVHSVQVRIIPKSKAQPNEEAGQEDKPAEAAPAPANGWSAGSDISAPLDAKFIFSKFVGG